MDAALPTGSDGACACVGCWGVVVASAKTFCNTHRVQRQSKYRSTHPDHQPVPELDEEAYERKSEARRTCATVQAYITWVEEHEGRVDTERQLKRHRYSLNSSKVGKHGTVNSGGGGPRSSKKAVAATEAAAPPTADAPTCIICCDAVAGVECRSNAHFCCFGCISATVVTWSDSYPLRIASGVRCPEGGFGSSGCGGTYDPESLRIGLSAAAAGHVTAAHVLAAQLPMKRDAHAAATGANVSMAVELWNGGLRDAAMGRLRRHLCDELLVSRCPKCMLQYAGVRPGDCMALECRMDNAPEGVEVKACGVYICGWCDAMTDTSAEMHKHVHDCPQKVGTQSYWSNANTNEYTNYEESLRRRRAARLADLALTIGDEAYAALRTAAQPVLAMHGL